MIAEARQAGEHPEAYARRVDAARDAHFKASLASKSTVASDLRGMLTLAARIAAADVEQPREQRDEAESYAALLVGLTVSMLRER